jgi:hypothetical protein
VGGIRFGITVDGKRSSYWRVRSGMKQPELFLEREAYGRQWHVTLHASGRWHMKESGKERVAWTKPAEVVPGYTRAVGIVPPVAVAHREDPAPEDVVLVPVGPDAEPTTFSTFIERPGANLNGWPGKNAAGTTFVGRIPLAASAGTCASWRSRSHCSPDEWRCLVRATTSCVRCASGPSTAYWSPRSSASWTAAPSR